MSAQLKVRRHRYYAYLRKNGEVDWMTRKFHVMFLEHPNWMPRFQVLQATGESRLMALEELRAIKKSLKSSQD